MVICRTCKKEYNYYYGNFRVNNKAFSGYSLDCLTCLRKDFEIWEAKLLNKNGKQRKEETLSELECKKMLKIAKSLSDKHTWQPSQYYIADIRFCEY